jgi:hypothetical protein
MGTHCNIPDDFIPNAAAEAELLPIFADSMRIATAAERDKE